MQPSLPLQKSEQAPIQIRVGSVVNPSWLRPLPFPRGIKSPSLRPSKRLHLPLTLASAALLRSNRAETRIAANSITRTASMSNSS